MIIMTSLRWQTLNWVWETPDSLVEVVLTIFLLGLLAVATCMVYYWYHSLDAYAEFYEASLLGATARGTCLPNKASF